MATEARASWPQVKMTAAEQVLAEMGGDAPLPAEPGSAPAAYFQRLVGAGKTTEAAMFLAHALPRYECVVWGARALIETDAVNRRDPLMTAILRWIDSPDDKVRRAIEGLVELDPSSTPATYLGKAVWLSGGSLSDPELPPVLPPPHVCAKMVGVAVINGAFAAKDPAGTLRRMLGIGEEMAAGTAR